jgi:hypothetical protein
MVSHPIITGAGQIALDRAGNIWLSVPDRNVIAVVTKDGKVQEIFRNPVNPTNGPGASTPRDAAAGGQRR